MDDEKERRRFFRLNDQVILDFKPLSNEQYQQWQEKNKLQKNNRDVLEKEIINLLQKTKSQYSDLGRLLELMNQKINLVSLQSIDSEASPASSISDQEGLTRINLSACGMSFQSNHAYKEGEYLMLNLMLKPSNTQVSLAGEVIGVDPIDDPEKPYKVRINFPDIQQAEQELLIQHLFQLQTSHLKRENENSD